MSVLTHDVGRQGVTPLPTNICGFDSETWDNYNNGNTTPWDLALDWPTTDVSSGALDITWDIQWGPHFDDTEEFVYYITKPTFNFQIGTPLTWDDFEATPFCKQTYDDKNPSANPAVVPNKAAATFKTSCVLPERSGRHVVYGEWGRNFFTFERFHGCIDVSFDGGNGSPNNAPIANPQSVSVDQDSSVAVTLSGSDSDGTVQSYNITASPASGTLSGTGSNRLYTPNTGFSGSDSFSFTVTDNDGASSSAATVGITINAIGGGTNQAPTASFSYIPTNLAVTFDGGASSDPDNGPDPLSYSWSFGDNASAIGANPSHTYASAGNYQVVLTVSDSELSSTDTKTVAVNQPTTGGESSCEYVVSNSWNSGFVAEIRIMNRGATVTNGWQVSWSYADGSAVSNGWNSTIAGAGPYTASNLGWNGLIEPGKTVVFGFQGTHGGSTSSVDVTGAVCN
jgi:PKD repeat protein